MADPAFLPSRRSLLTGLLFCLLAILPLGAAAQVFPIYDAYQSFRDDKHRETHAMWPFYIHKKTSDTLNVAVHPFYSYYEETDTKQKDIDVLWPIYTYRYRPELGAAEDYERSYLFPLFYDRKEERFGRVVADRFILPIWFEGSQGTTGRYQILFPFYWYARNARLSVPLFPQRPVTFGAIFPIAGDIRGYFNRDRVAFFLWPLLVYSSEGQRGTADFNEIFSFLWPVFGLYKGPKVSGFRVWPLFASVKKEDEFHRMYWLWPLGHYRKGRISRMNPEHEDVTLFIPFYARFRRPNIKLDMLFPFYGRLEVGDRISQGYALALYNVDINTRRKTREDRFFWFLIRKKTRLKDYSPESGDPQATVGGGFFPFYTRTYSDTRVAKNIVWPFHTYRQTEYDQYTFTRSYIIPFYVFQRRDFDDGRYAYTKFVFPFFRSRKTLDGQQQSNALHLFFYTYAGPMDRSLAPLWTVWEKQEDVNTDAKSIRAAKNLWTYEKREDGAEKRTFNLLFIDYESVKKPGESEQGHTRLFWGLIGRHKSPELKTELLGKKF